MQAGGSGGPARHTLSILAGAEGQREELQYYRQNLPLNFQEWDDSSMKPER